MANIPASRDAPSGSPSSNSVSQAPNSNQSRVEPASISASDTAVQTLSAAVQTMNTAIQTPSAAIQTLSTAIQSLSTAVQTLSTDVQPQSTAIQTLSTAIRTISTAVQTQGTTIQTLSTAIQTLSIAIQTLSRDASTVVQARRTVIQTPCTAVQTPRTAMQASSTAVQPPCTAIQTPNTTGQTPSTTIQTPSTVAQAPNNPQLIPNPGPRPTNLVYLPLPAQHQLLVYLQSLLELLCYTFGQNVQPDVMKRRDWGCADAVELNIWIDAFEVFLKKEIPLRTRSVQAEPLLRTIANIRHNAVHRRPVSNWQMERYLFDADRLARILGYGGSGNRIVMLYQKTKSTMDELEENRQLSQSEFQETLRGIVVQGEEMNRLKSLATAEKERKDKEYEVLALKGIREAVKLAETLSSTLWGT